MANVPLTYNLRSLWVRKSSTLLTVISIGATVAVLAGVLALQKGFESLFIGVGSDDHAVFLRPGATTEGDSEFAPSRARTLMKSLPEIAIDEDGQPLASAESYLAVRRLKLSGGETNVPIRGVQPASFKIHGESLRLIDGRNFEPGTDEVIVGEKLTRRIQDCELGATIQLNTTPFKVVGVFENDGPFASEIWCDVDRMSQALERPNYSRVLAVLNAGVDIEELSERLKSHKEVPAKAMTERDFLEGQTSMLSGALGGLGFFLAVIMGIAAVFTATNTMQAALSARGPEIGILLSLGFRPFPIFLSFMVEALVLGLVGGAFGILFALPLDGIETGTANMITFSEVAFAFSLTPAVLIDAVTFAVILGLLGGALPAWRASRMEVIDALRRA
ncbi:MAG: putative ABC transport system permease protein [Planctomycetota bacterium]